MINPREALKKLISGNDRFVSQKSVQRNFHIPDQFAKTAKKQTPFAVIVGCSDSRVPVEILFDQWIGDLFVVRTAGNIIQPTQIGSVEFAVENFGTRLVVVLGHSNCGAVQAALDKLQDPSLVFTPGIKNIVEQITDSLDQYSNETDSLSIPIAVRANICGSVNQLWQESDILKKYIKNNGLLILGAEYSLESGKVEFLNKIEQD